MPHEMCPYLEDHSLGLPRLLGRLVGGTLFVFGIQGTHSIFVCSCSTAELSSHLLGHVFTPQKESPDPPRGFFGDRSLSSLCGPVGSRGVPPHHRPIHPELFQWEEFTISPGCCASTSILCRDAPIPRRLVDSRRIQDH